MFPEGEKLLWEGMVFLAFALVCGALVERRFSRLVSAAVAGGALMGICLLQGALLAHGLDRTLVLTLLPLTAYVPAVLVLHALSRSEWGLSPQAWLAERRISHVRKWLAESDLPIAELALRAGYADQSALTRAMQRLTGLTPAACANLPPMILSVPA